MITITPSDGENNRLNSREVDNPATGATPGEFPPDKGDGSTAFPAVASTVARPRISRLQLTAIKSKLGAKDLDILMAIKKHRFLLTGQVQRLFFTSGSTQEANVTATTRTLRKLRDQHLIGTLERRIGGVRAGSSSQVWHLTEPGERLLRLDLPDNLPRKRFEEPSAMFLEHTLAVAECAVQLTCLCRDSHDLELKSVDSEPTCWRPFRVHGRTIQLKPDLFAITTYDDYEDRWFIELDLGTESLGQVVDKCRTYRSYFYTGKEQEESGLFPLVVWIVPDEKRKAAMKERITSELPSDPKMFLVITPDQLEKMLRQFLGRDDLC